MHKIGVRKLSRMVSEIESFNYVSRGGSRAAATSKIEQP